MSVIDRTAEVPASPGLSATEIPVPEPAKKRESPLALYGPLVASLGFFMGVWWFVRQIILKDYQRFLLPWPWTILRHGFTEKDDPKNPIALFKALGSTVRTSMTGLAIAAAIGIILAVAMSFHKSIERSIYPYGVIFQAIPILALTPVIRLIFGNGYMARSIICVIIAVFPIMVNTLFGLKSAEQGMHDLFTLHGANWWTRLTKLKLNAALPAMFEGFRISAGLSVIGAIVGEFYMRQGDKGLGALIDYYYSKVWNEQMYAAITFTAIYGLVIFGLFGLLSKLAVGRWYNAKR